MTISIYFFLAGVEYGDWITHRLTDVWLTFLLGLDLLSDSDVCLVTDTVSDAGTVYFQW